MYSISLPTARQLMLAAQGLDRLPEQPATQRDVLAMIRRMGFLQIDTIHVVARSPYLTLWSRLGDYPPAWLDELLAEGALFEYWAHAACFLPIEDYPLYRRIMLDAIRAKDWPARWAVNWIRENPQAIERMRAHLQQNGAVRSADFENKDRPSGGWWNWKEEKNALEALFMTGELMIARRQKFQRVYDRRERVLPGWDDAAAPSTEAVCRTQTLRAVRALGVALPAWIPDYFRQPKKEVFGQLQALVAEGLLAQVQVQGFEDPAYIHPEQFGLLEQVAAGGRVATLTTLLSPFDPLVSDRQRARQLFNFDYTIECYTPAPRRIYGYFSLPILWRGQIIGRLDAKAHRADKLFEIKTLHLEAGVALSEALMADLAAALRRLAAWHSAPELAIRQSNPPDCAALLSAAWQG